MTDIRTFLKENVLLFDGSMGTYYSGKKRQRESVVERANLTAPEEIRSIHREYLDAGAKALKTNTFAVNPVNWPDRKEREELIHSAVRIASETAGEDAYVFADIGPVRPVFAPDREEMLLELVKEFLDAGAEHFLFETQSDASGIPEACRYIREHRTEAFIIVNFNVGPDGFSVDGFHISELVKEAKEADAVGMNCGCVASHMSRLLDFFPADSRKISAMPNAAYAGRNGLFYDTDPRYYAEKMAEMIAKGVSLPGGCCGTTPEHIRCLAERIRGRKPVPLLHETKDRKTSAEEPNPLEDKIRKGQPVILVEFDPPKDAVLSPFMEGARELMEAGIDAMTIADCPIARASVDSSLLACKVKRELGLEVVPHMTCRDRNMNASKALLLGLYGEGIRNVLLVTGDPVPTAERGNMKGVFQFDSARFAGYVRSFSELELHNAFALYGALNVNANRFDMEIERAEKKMESGIFCFLTQPVTSETGLNNLVLARSRLKEARILGGIIPIVSEKNARFMDTEIRGMNVDTEIIERFHGLDREQGEELGRKIALETASKMLPYVDGYYLVTPFRRTALMVKLVRAIREMWETQKKD